LRFDTHENHKLNFSKPTTHLKEVSHNASTTFNQRGPCHYSSARCEWSEGCYPNPRLEVEVKVTIFHQQEDGSVKPERVSGFIASS